MGDPSTAAQDPVFYVHHSNMDRLWNIWKAQGGGRVDPLSDSTWKNTPFTFFDENKTQLTMTGCDVLRAAEQLNYTYEGEPTQVKEYCLRIIFPPWIFQLVELIRWPGPPIELGPDPVSIPIELKDIRQRIMSIAESKTETLFLKLEGVEADRQPGVVWEIYAGLPPNTAPDPEGPYYVGAMSLFSAGVHSKAQHDFKPAEFAFSLDRVIPAAMRTNAEKLELTIVPSGILINGKRSQPRVAAKVRIGRLSIAVETQRKSTR